MKPILFSGPMVRAILEGRKTETRRPVKLPKWIPAGAEEEAMAALARHPTGLSMPGPADGERVFRCPFGSPGDLMWVRETYCELDREGWEDPDKPRDFLGGRYGRPRRNACAYKADTDAEGDRIRKEYGYRWTPSIHMPRWASRLTLKVLEVWVERLWQITEEGAQAEGFEPLDLPDMSPEQVYSWEHGDARLVINEPRRLAFSSAWDDIYGPEGEGRGWAFNPWVWVCRFEKVAPGEGADGRTS